MSTRPGEAALIRAHGLRVIRVGGRKDRGEWEKLTLVARSWGKLERERGRLGDGPWIVRLNWGGSIARVGLR
jgi:hypothetical protein